MHHITRRLSPSPIVAGFALLAVLALSTALLAAPGSASAASAPKPGSWTRLLDRPISAERLGLPASAPATRLARAALRRTAGRLGLRSSLRGLQLLSVQRAPDLPGARNLRTLRFRQTVDGLRVLYELADELTVLAEPNPGPWTGRRIADVEGRVEGTFICDGQVEIHVHLFRSALGRRRQILEYQVHQTRAGADIAVRTSGPLDPDAVSRELVNALAELGVAQPEVRVAEVDEIERTGSTGKLRRFIPLALQRN